MRKPWRKDKELEILAAEEAGVKNAGEGKKEPLTKEQKKKRRKKMIIGTAVACLVLFMVAGAFAPEPLPVVTVRNAAWATIEQSVDTSGTVRTEKKKTYFSPLSAKVSECKVMTGDVVAAGDVLLLYDAEDLQNREREASLQNEEAYFSYQDIMAKSNEEAAEYSRSSHDVEILQQQVEVWKGEVRALKQYITDLGCHLRDATKEGHENQAAEIQSKIDQATNDLAVKQEELAEFESNLAEQKSIKNASGDAALTANKRKQVEATKELAALKAEQVTSAVAQVSEGLKAEFRGIVTDIKAVEGSVVQESGELLTVESNEEVCVEITLSKSDLEKVQEGQKAVVTIVGREYKGTVSRISRSAIKNEKGASVVAGEVHIDDPDEAVFLGVEAKVAIEGQKAENVVTVPVEAVNIGKNGSFVYIVKDGIIETRAVETGIASMEAVEIKSGLDGTEQVVLTAGSQIVEGARVTPVEG